MKNKPHFKSFYPLLVWAITLLTGPVVWMLNKIVDQGDLQNIGIYDLFFPMIFLSVFISLPTLLVTFIAYKIAGILSQDPSVIRFVILIFTLFGVWVSFYLLVGSRQIDLSISYSVAALIAILFTSPKKKLSPPVTFH